MNNLKQAHTDGICRNAAGVPISLAAIVMKKSPMFIRIGLRKGSLPFGAAFKTNESNEKYSYYISPKLFEEYTGYKYIFKKREKIKKSIDFDR